MFKTLLKKYLTVFVLTFAGYTFLNRLLCSNFGLPINQDHLTLWIPAAIGAALSFFIFRPIVKKLKYHRKATNFLLFIMIPFSIMVPIWLSQAYFMDIGHKLISINKPADMYNYPDERFFNILSFAVAPKKHFFIRERHTMDKSGTTIQVSHYYITPVYNDTNDIANGTLSTIGYGIKFSTSMSKQEQESMMPEFNLQAKQDYEAYNFFEPGFFESIKNTDEADYYAEAMKYSTAFDHAAKNVVLVKRAGTLKDLLSKDEDAFLYSTLISLGVILLTLFLYNFFSRQKPSA